MIFSVMTGKIIAVECSMTKDTFDFPTFSMVWHYISDKQYSRNNRLTVQPHFTSPCSVYIFNRIVLFVWFVISLSKC